MKRILTSIWFLGLIIAVPVIILLPDVFKKYRVKQISAKYDNVPGTSNYYVDLNNDSIKELVSCQL